MGRVSSGSQSEPDLCNCLVCFGIAVECLIFITCHVIQMWTLSQVHASWVARVRVQFVLLSGARELALSNWRRMRGARGNSYQRGMTFYALDSASLSNGAFCQPTRCATVCSAKWPTSFVGAAAWCIHGVWRYLTANGGLSIWMVLKKSRKTEWNSKRNYSQWAPWSRAPGQPPVPKKGGMQSWRARPEIPEVVEA